MINLTVDGLPSCPTKNGLFSDHENVHRYGTHSGDIDGELAQLDTDGYRPLRLAPQAGLGFFYTWAGRFPRGRGELPDEAVEFVARQVGVEPAEFGLYEWSGRTVEYHRAQIRTHLGFRECSVSDAEQLTQWLAGAVCEAERRPELVRDELLARCRAQRIVSIEAVRRRLGHASTETTQLYALLDDKVAGDEIRAARRRARAKSY